MSKLADLAVFANFNLISVSEPTSPPTTTHPTIKPVKDDSKGQSSFLPLIVGAIGACALLFLIFLLIFIALKRRRDMVNTQREGEKRMKSRNSILIKSDEEEKEFNRLRQFSEQESKSNPNHIQNDSAVNGGRGLSSPIHRNRLIRINITPNPLDSEKVS